MMSQVTFVPWYLLMPVGCEVGSSGGVLALRVHGLLGWGLRCGVVKMQCQTWGPSPGNT